MFKITAITTFFVLLMTALGGCSENTKTYKTLDDVESANMFEKGWLPRETLPKSSNAIRITTFVDIAAGDGSFNFACPEYSDFRSQVQPYDSTPPNISAHTEMIQDHVSNGYEAFMHSNKSTIWVFLCIARQDGCICDFVLWQP